uniref:Uncharacterized protein n=1 Tax=Ananas comosus var. bracteatus TaxID=296719 RepID=A0A6V7NXR8_ANACO|nr:unnamed protein product [Ananas comosus var. bracteatus]
MSRSNVAIVVHWNGEIFAHDSDPKYVGGRKKLSGIPVDITFTEFERKIYRLTDTSRDEYRLIIKVRYSTGMNQFDVVEVTDDDSLCGAMALSGNPPCLIIFVEKEIVLSQGYYSRMLNSDFNVDVLFPGPERESFRADIGGGANAPREYDFSNVVVCDPPPLPRTIHHATGFSSHAPLGREQGVSCEEGFHTSHDVHDFGSYPLGTENDGIGNRAKVQQEVAEDGYTTDHEGVGHESSNLAVNENIVAEAGKHNEGGEWFTAFIGLLNPHESGEPFTAFT